jgi:hypothetical protein
VRDASAFGALRTPLGEGPALATALLFGLATPAFTTSGQAMWSTTGEVFCLCLALRLQLPGVPTRATLAAAGLALAAAFVCRPTALVPAGVLALLAFERSRRAIWLALPLGAGVLAASVLLFRTYGHPLGGYGLMNSGSAMWGGSVLTGLAGNLVSPSRGALLWFPHLLFVPLAWRYARHDESLRGPWLASLAISLFTLALAASYRVWWGGYSTGPRLLAEAAPFLAILLSPLAKAWSELGGVRLALAVATALAAATQVLSAYGAHAVAWNEEVRMSRRPEVLWSIRDSQLAAAWVPRWEPSREPAMVAAPAEIDGAPARWLRLDISPAANARYERDPFRKNAPDDGWSHYGRLEASAHLARTSLFRFLPRGAPNAATTCQRAGSVSIPVPRTTCRRIHAVLAAGATERGAGTPVIASWELVYADGALERLPLSLNADVWEYHPDRRSAPIDPSHLYRGGADDADALVKWSGEVGRPAVRLAALRLVNAEPASGAGVTVFAVTLER